MDQDHQQWRDFLMRACHDLRTPLRAVRTNAELLLRAPETREGPEFDQMLGFLVDGATKANLLVDGLSNYAAALHVRRNPIPVSTGVLLRSALAKLAAEIASTGAEVTYDDLPQVPGDPDRLMQLFENLLRNAIQHRGDKLPRIHVSAQQKDDEWTFSVRDQGPGIEAEDLDRIFRPFERLEAGRNTAGLGLATCRMIVEGHGGRIWAESSVPGGTTIYFTLEAS